MSEDVDASIERELNTLDGRRVREDGLVVAMGLGDDGTGKVERHVLDVVGFDGAGEDFDAVGTVVDLLVDTGDGSEGWSGPRAG